MKTRILLLTALAVLALTTGLSAAAMGSGEEDAGAELLPLAKNGLINQTISFAREDFQGEDGLDGIVITSLPDPAAGALTLGGQAVGEGDVIALSAVDGLRFTPASAPSVLETAFSFQPLYSNGAQGTETQASLYLLTQANGAPVAERLELNTYQNVAVTGRFAAVDPEGDLLTYRLVKKPARGAVTISDDGQFVYTPYENKTGKDSFTYIAMDTVGNASDPATVKVCIEKPDTKVTYADLSGHPAHRDAIRLAEEGVFVGECMGEQYFFQPDALVTRGEFVAMAMNMAGVEALEGVERTGFADDAAIPTWAKPYVSSALKCGLVQGSRDEAGRVVFQANDPMTTAEAAVLLNRALGVTDVDVGAFGPAEAPDWAAQAVANLSTCGVLSSGSSLSEGMTRADAAQLLCASLDLLEQRDTGWF